MARDHLSTFQLVLSGRQDQVRLIEHPWFRTYAQNHNGHPALVIQCTLDTGRYIDDGEGFRIKAVRGGTVDYVRVTSTDDGISPLFLMLVDFILTETSAPAAQSEATEALAESIERFRQFSRPARRGRLSEREVRGAFAEISMLRLILSSGVPPLAAISSWRGPFAMEGLGVHDFILANGNSIEVKSMRQHRDAVRVSSPNQLVPGGYALDLVVLPIEGVSHAIEASVSFRGLAAETQELFLKAGSQAADAWRAAVGALGLDMADEWYDQWHFLPGEWLRFAVDEGFPHLSVSSLDKGIVRVEYSLELSQIEAFRRPMTDLLAETLKGLSKHE